MTLIKEDLPPVKGDVWSATDNITHSHIVKSINRIRRYVYTVVANQLVVLPYVDLSPVVIMRSIDQSIVDSLSRKSK
jgi:hypothetical protein